MKEVLTETMLATSTESLVVVGTKIGVPETSIRLGLSGGRFRLSYLSNVNRAPEVSIAIRVAEAKMGFGIKLKQKN